MLDGKATVQTNTIKNGLTYNFRKELVPTIIIENGLTFNPLRVEFLTNNKKILKHFILYSISIVIHSKIDF